MVSTGSGGAHTRGGIVAVAGPFGKVEGVQIVNNVPVLNIDGISESLDKVVSIGNGGS